MTDSWRPLKLLNPKYNFNDLCKFSEEIVIELLIHVKID